MTPLIILVLSRGQKGLVSITKAGWRVFLYCWLMSTNANVLWPLLFTHYHMEQSWKWIFNRLGGTLYVHHKGSLASCTLHRTMRMSWGGCNQIISKHSLCFAPDPFHLRIMSYRPTKRAKKAPDTIQRGAYIEMSTSRGPQVWNVGIAPAPSVGTGWENPGRDRQHTQGPAFNAPDHVDFFIPTDEEVRAAYRKVSPFGLSKWVIYNSGIDAKWLDEEIFRSTRGFSQPDNWFRREGSNSNLCTLHFPWCMVMCGLSRPPIILSDALPGFTFQTHFPQDPGMDQPILFGLSNMGGGGQALPWSCRFTLSSIWIQ